MVRSLAFAGFTLHPGQTSAPFHPTRLSTVQVQVARKMAARACHFEALLSHGPRARVLAAARAVLTTLAKAPERTDYEALTREKVGAVFPHVSPAGADALCLATLAEASQGFDPDLRGIIGDAKAMQKLKDEAKNSLDLQSESGETESLRLQMAMDRVSKFMTALSNIEKKAGDTSDAIVQNIK